MIELRGIKKTYRLPTGESLRVLDDVNLIIPKGKIMGVIGRSGAGKSTLVRCVNGLEKPDSGEVFLDGQSLLTVSASALRKARSKMGMIFQNVNLQKRKTVFENVAFPLILQGDDKDAIRKRVMSLLDQVSLTDRVDHFPSQLSGGQQQRVAIARALATAPPVLLCDEMTSALDPETTQQILSLLLSLQRSLNLTVLLITHEMAAIRQVADRVAVMEAGQLIEEGSVLDIFQKPKTETTKALVQSDAHLGLPASLQAVCQAEPVESGYHLLNCTFSGAVAAQPLISECTTRFGVALNILQANLTTVHGSLMGKMCVAIELSDHLPQVVGFLKESGLTVEALGYVNRNDWSLS